MSTSPKTAPEAKPAAAPAPWTPARGEMADYYHPDFARNTVPRLATCYPAPNKPGFADVEVHLHPRHDASSPQIRQQEKQDVLCVERLEDAPAGTPVVVRIVPAWGVAMETPAKTTAKSKH